MAKININKVYAAMESRTVNGLIRATKTLAQKRVENTSNRRTLSGGCKRAGAVAVR